MHYALAAVTLGRTCTAAIAAISCALVLAACGGSDATTATTADQPGGATAATAATASSGKSSKSNSNTKKSASAEKAKNSDFTKTGKSDSTSSSESQSSGNENKAANPVRATELSSKAKREVRTAFTNMISAFNSHNVAYLCKQAYAKDFLDFTAKKGGCVAYTNKILSTVKSYSAKVDAVSEVAGSNRAQVSATLTPVTDKGKQNVKAIFYFSPESGEWKRAAPQ